MAVREGVAGGALRERPTAAPLAKCRVLVGPQSWFGGIIELVTGIAVAAGAFTTWAAFLASGTMAVAYIQFHWKLNLGARFFPAVNQGELALLYSVVFLYIACRGGGRWSLDRRRARRTRVSKRG